MIAELIMLALTTPLRHTPDRDFIGGLVFRRLIYVLDHG